MRGGRLGLLGGWQMHGWVSYYWEGGIEMAFWKGASIDRIILWDGVLRVEWSAALYFSWGGRNCWSRVGFMDMKGM
jgi:hypothetical protein